MLGHDVKNGNPCQHAKCQRAYGEYELGEYEMFHCVAPSINARLRALRSLSPFSWLAKPFAAINSAPLVLAYVSARHCAPAFCHVSQAEPAFGMFMLRIMPPRALQGIVRS